MERAGKVAVPVEALQRLLRDLADDARGWPADGHRDGVVDVLARFGAATHVDALSLMLIEPDGRIAESIPWSYDDGTRPPIVLAVSGITLDEFTPFGAPLLKAGVILPISDVSAFAMTDGERRLCEDLGIRAVMQVPVTDAGRLVALVSVVCRLPLDRWPSDLGWWAGEVGRTVASAVQQHRADREERRRAARARALAEQVPDPLLFVSDGVVRWASPSTQRVLGWESDSLVGSRLDDLDVAGRLGAVCAAVARNGDASGVDPLEVAVATAGGDRLWCEARFAPIGLDGEVEVLVALRDIHLHRMRHEDLAMRASTDPLTGLLNREGLWQRFVDGADVGCVLFVDLDGFKAVNDLHGHGVGDRLLAAVADRVRGTVRPGDEVARFGGDEFVVLLRGNCTVAEAEVIAARLIAAVERPYDIGRATCRVGASIGITPAEAAATPAEVLAAADRAMYEAKRRGKGRAVLSSPRSGR